VPDFIRVTPAPAHDPRQARPQQAGFSGNATLAIDRAGDFGHPLDPHRLLFRTGLRPRAYACSFVVKCVKLVSVIFSLTDNEVILVMLGLIDACLAASLMVMVMLTGYENYISRLDHEDADELAWLGKIDTGSLKVKIASAIVAISSIHLLQVFLNAAHYTGDTIMWTTLIHLAFVLSAFSLAVVDRIAASSKSKPGEDKGQ
jgi:uncharacterized protein (TIGR00645 family)